MGTTVNFKFHIGGLMDISEVQQIILRKIILKKQSSIDDNSAVMVWLRENLDLFLILAVFTSIISKSTSNRYVNTTLNITSSDNNRLKIISFNVDQNAAVNVTYELMQSWDHILVKTIIYNYLKNDFSFLIF